MKFGFTSCLKEQSFSNDLLKTYSVVHLTTQRKAEHFLRRFIFLLPSHLWMNLPKQADTLEALLLLLLLLFLLLYFFVAVLTK